MPLPPPSPSDGPPPSPPPAGLLVLVAGDEMTRSAAVSVAGSGGYELRGYAAIEAAAAARPAGPACLIYDAVLKPVGPTPAEAARSAGLACPVVLVTPPTTVRAAVRAMEAGAAAVLEKPCGASDLLPRVARGLAADAERIERQRAVRDAEGRLRRLTEKEQETLALILMGKTNREIADDLGLSVRAVEDRRSRTIKRAGAANLLDLVRIVHEAGWSRRPAA